jgi:aldose 1-epimerase
VALLLSAGCGGPHDQLEDAVQVSAALSSEDGRNDGRPDGRHHGSIQGPVAFGTIDLTANGTGTCTGPKAAQIWTLTNRRGMIAKLTDFGATLVELHVPDKAGHFVDIVQGFDDVSGYANSQFAGASVGRVGNRIVDGIFTLDGTTYTVTGAGPAGSNNHALHGGPCGWDKNVWTADAKMTDDGPEIAFSLTSADGDMNFPGRVKARSVYTLTDDNQLKIRMSATTDRDTPINMLHHSYFNLGGAGSGSIFGHELVIFADTYTPAAAATGVPDGTIKGVAGTPFDFRHAHAIGLFAAEAGVGDQVPPGYDHNWVVRGDPHRLRPVARVKDPVSGRVMTIEADQPGVQFYTTNFRPDPNVLPYVPTIGKGGKPYKIHEAFALETQKHPNAINFPPSVRPGREDEIVRPAQGETYSHQMVIRFSAE